jgi:four helix bundle protein
MLQRLATTYWKEGQELALVIHRLVHAMPSSKYKILEEEILRTSYRISPPLAEAAQVESEEEALHCLRESLAECVRLDSLVQLAGKAGLLSWEELAIVRAKVRAQVDRLEEIKGVKTKSPMIAHGAF